MHRNGVGTKGIDEERGIAAVRNLLQLDARITHDNLLVGLAHRQITEILFGDPHYLVIDLKKSKTLIRPASCGERTSAEPHRSPLPVLQGAAERIEDIRRETALPV